MNAVMDVQPAATVLVETAGFLTHSRCWHRGKLGHTKPSIGMILAEAGGTMCRGKHEQALVCIRARTINHAHQRSSHAL